MQATKYDVTGHQFNTPGVVARGFASQSKDQGFNPLVESYRKTSKKVSIASLLGARHLWEVVENKPAKFACCVLGQGKLTGRPTFMCKTVDPEMATPKRVQTYRPTHSDTSLFREWRINKANKKKVSKITYKDFK